MYGLESQEIRVLLTAGGRGFLFLVALTPGVRFTHSPPSATEVKNT